MTEREKKKTRRKKLNPNKTKAKKKSKTKTFDDTQANTHTKKYTVFQFASDHIMLIGSNLNSDFGPLPSAPWNMEPPRLPLSTGGGSLPQSTNIQLSPTGKLKS